MVVNIMLAAAEITTREDSTTIMAISKTGIVRISIIVMDIIIVIHRAVIMVEMVAVVTTIIHTVIATDAEDIIIITNIIIISIIINNSGIITISSSTIKAALDNFAVIRAMDAEDITIKEEVATVVEAINN